MTNDDLNLRTKRVGRQLDPLTLVVPVTQTENFPVYSDDCPFMVLAGSNEVRKNYDQFSTTDTTWWTSSLNANAAFLANGTPVNKITPRAVL